MRRVIHAPCPLCKADIEYLYQTEEIPYFSEILLITAGCSCGYHLADTVILNEGDPVRWTLTVEGGDDLNARVVRSTSGRVEIPEFGVLIEPGPICDAYISNVEGVLARVEDVLNMALGWAEEEDERARNLELQERVRKAREGTEPFTLIIEDLSGNSAIISPKAEKTILKMPEADV